MRYKGYKMVNFCCLETDTGKIKAAFKQAVNSVANDDMSEQVKMQAIADMIQMSVGTLFEPERIQRVHPFEIHKLEDKEDANKQANSGDKEQQSN